MTADDAKKFRLGYVTDVEGNMGYFLRFVQQSNVLDVQEGDISSKILTLHLRENCYFVYGGDAIDKGMGDIRMVRALVDLKQRHPDRVHLLVGNRDLNKLRWTAELSNDDMARPINTIPSPFWDPQAPTLQQYLQAKQQLLLQDLSSQDTMPQQVPIESLNTRTNRLQYLLQHTLGCPDTFRFRRMELALLADLPESQISDDQVVDSFIHEVASPQGSLRQYMELANIAVCIGNTLFCHGAVDQATMQFIPSLQTKFHLPTTKAPPAAMIDNVHEWTKALNQFLKEGLIDFEKRPYWNHDRTSRGGEALMAMQNRPAMWGRTIVSNCYGDGGCITTSHAARFRDDPQRKQMQQTNPLAFEDVTSDPTDLTVAAWLLKDGIQRVVVGHKPTGDCPAVLSPLYSGVEIVSADTSFSDTSAHDNRGQALAIVEIVGESPTDNQLVLSGVLRDGSNYSSTHVRLHPEGVDPSTGDPNLGTTWGDQGWWIKAIVNANYYLTRGNGRQVEYHTISKVSVTETMSRKT